MNTLLEKTTELAISLPLSERMQLLDTLQASLQKDSFRMSPEWRTELESRLKAYEAGEVELTDLEDVEKRLDSLFNE